MEKRNSGMRGVMQAIAEKVNAAFVRQPVRDSYARRIDRAWETGVIDAVEDYDSRPLPKLLEVLVNKLSKDGD